MTTIAITGATDGLGRALAVRLAGDGVRLVLHGRDAARLDDVAAEVARAGGPEPVTVTADLADLAQVARPGGGRHEAGGHPRRAGEQRRHRLRGARRP